MANWRFTLLTAFMTMISGIAVAEPNGDEMPKIKDVLVYIECKLPDGRVSKGSGVIVSKFGRILTAKHVAPPNSECFAAVGTAANLPTLSLIRDAKTVTVDAILLKFKEEKEYPFLKFTRLEGLQGADIVAHGFPSSGTGAMSVSNGVVSSTITNSQGVFPTTNLQASGMSGGPVILKSNGSLLGIVAGAEFDAVTGAPSSYGVLAAQEVATVLELTALNSSALETKRLKFDAITMNPGEVKNFPIKLDKAGAVDVFMDSIRLAASGGPTTNELAIKVCPAESNVDTPCPHSQLGIDGVLRRTLPAGPATLTVINFGSNSKLTFSMRAEF